MVTELIAYYLLRNVRPEIGFENICHVEGGRPRVIWHRVIGTITFDPVQLDKLNLTMRLEGSKFPSHRLWVNGEVKGYQRQGFLGLLWNSDPKDPTKVK